MEQTFWMKSSDETEIYIKRWHTENPNPKAIIQLSHGMVEHIGRYQSFANYLIDKGFIVYGNDHRGHGQTGLKQGLLGYFADEDGFLKTMEDLHQITLMIMEKHPNTPIILLGHSMGSFLARYYVQKYSHLIDGVILSGTGGFPPSITKSGKALASLLPAKKQSKLMNQLAFGNYNKKIKSNKTAYDWLSRDEEEVKKYVEDPLSGYVPTAKFFVDLMSGLDIIQQQPDSIRKDLPMLLISGSEDPVGNYEKGVWKTAKLYERTGLENVTTFLFIGARHELLNELNKKEVYSVIDNWINQQLN
ncbi:alpha/beta hydrolase [Oceanobacillus salinisoli]|uniref:alpha/beta hydrolase n=1 Tax=Oceanobacillus salinisoli TaxID=2678611 RepID=UPI0012E157FB|nr:alpha/beta hydrolase [Oceanobacillus salinisoli]